MSQTIDRRHREHRLLPHQVRAIRRLARRGFDQETVGRAFKTTQSNVSYISRGLTHR